MSLSFKKESQFSNCSIALMAPELPPAFCGVGDYSERLLKELNPDKQWVSLVMKNKEASQSFWPEALIYKVKKNDSDLKRILDLNLVNTLILQYTVFAYDEKGLPNWLFKALDYWKSTDNNKKIIIMVHEVWGGASPWQPGFYRQPIQKLVLGRLIGLSDVVFTSGEGFKRKLEKAFGKKCIISPIPSNIEPISPPWWSHEQVKQSGMGRLCIAIFGNHRNRLNTLRWHEGLIRKLEENGKIEKIFVFGKGLKTNDEQSPEARLLHKYLPKSLIAIEGELEASAVSVLLSSSHIFLNHYKYDEIDKSGTIKSALSHGVVPILKGSRTEHTSIPMVFFDGKKSTANQLVDQLNYKYLASMGRDGLEWYKKTYSWGKVTKTYIEALDSDCYKTLK